MFVCVCVCDMCVCDVCVCVCVMCVCVCSILLLVVGYIRSKQVRQLFFLYKCCPFCNFIVYTLIENTPSQTYTRDRPKQVSKRKTKSQLLREDYGAILAKTLFFIEWSKSVKGGNSDNIIAL